MPTIADILDSGCDGCDVGLTIADILDSGCDGCDVGMIGQNEVNAESSKEIYRCAYIFL